MDESLRPAFSAEDVLAHPRFAEARAAYMREILGMHENRTSLNRLLMDEGRAYVFFTVITMNAGYRPEDRTTWPTVQRLKEAMEENGIASGRRVHDIVQRLVETGYVHLFSAPTDKRTTLLEPTEKMLAHDQQALIAYYRPLDVLFPDPGYPEPMRRDPAFQRVARQIGFGFIKYSQAFIMANPTIALFLPREAGFMILTKLMALSLERDDDARLDISLTEIGDSFGVSRTHVRKLLSEAERQGLARLEGGHAALTEAAQVGFDRFVADTCVGNDLVYRMAMQQLRPAAVA